jgi:hypothetical protein
MQGFDLFSWVAKGSGNDWTLAFGWSLDFLRGRRLCDQSEGLKCGSLTTNAESGAETAQQNAENPKSDPP